MTGDDTWVENNFIGAGWAFRPEGSIGIDGQGGIALVQGNQDIMKSIYLILSTAPGERVMRTEFGCGIHSLVFSSPGPQTFGLVSYHVQEALGRWEPRIEVTKVEVTTDPRNASCLLIDINYKIRQTNHERNLVYPYYIIPRGED